MAVQDIGKFKCSCKAWKKSEEGIFIIMTGHWGVHIKSVSVGTRDFLDDRGHWEVHGFPA
jgi:hypothetical protein